MTFSGGIDMDNGAKMGYSSFIFEFSLFFVSTHGIFWKGKKCVWYKMGKFWYI